MKKFSIFFLVMIFILTGCNEQIIDENKLYSVTFEENGGNEVEDIFDIQKGSTIILPDISKPGHIFKGWYTSKNFISGTMVTNETEIGKNIKVYAKWEATPYNLNLNLDGGVLKNGYYSGDNYINYGVEVELGIPTKNGYLFDGWFIDGVEFDGKLVITSDTYVTTKWVDINTLEKEYSVKLNINGGSFYKYNSKEEMMEDFYNDFAKFTNREINSSNFWDMSYSRIVGNRGFFSNDKYFEKWSFLLEYLSTTARPDNKNYILEVLKRDDLNWDLYDEIVSTVRNELLAFFLNTERVVPKWEEIKSADYSQKELQEGYLKYIEITVPDIYETGKGFELPTPLKKDYIFLGWYDNNNFEGSIYTNIDINEYGDKEFYALWGKVE